MDTLNLHLKFEIEYTDKDKRKNRETNKVMLIVNDDNTDREIKSIMKANSKKRNKTVKFKIPKRERNVISDNIMLKFEMI